MAATWFTLVRIKNDPTQLTGVSQARTAREALDQLGQWHKRYPDHTAVVFDPNNQPILRQALEEQG